MYVYLDGKFVKPRDAYVSLYDSGYQYGYGLFETFRTYSGKAFLLREHYKRLSLSAKKLKLQIPSYVQLKNAVGRLVRINKLDNAIIRLTMSKKLNGRRTISLVPRAIDTRKAIYSRGVLCATKRIDAYNFENSKTLSFLSYIIARNSRGKMFELLLINKDGYVTEGSVSNVFVFKGGVLITPKLDLGIIGGITRDFVKKLARRLNIRTVDWNFGIEQLFTSDECFLTNSTKGIVPVCHVDGKKIGTGKVGKITRLLMNEYQKEIGEQRNFL